MVKYYLDYCDKKCPLLRGRDQDIGHLNTQV